MRRNHSLPLLSGQLWPGVVIPVWISFIGYICLIIKYSYLKFPLAKLKKNTLRKNDSNIWIWPFNERDFLICRYDLKEPVRNILWPKFMPFLISFVHISLLNLIHLAIHLQKSFQSPRYPCGKLSVFNSELCYCSPIRERHSVCSWLDHRCSSSWPQIMYQQQLKV